jgi:hypothetical protein
MQNFDLAKTKLFYLSYQPLEIRINATPDDLLDPMTALLSHPKWLVVKRRIMFFCVIVALTM